jgi:CubicO group peptidase (beta-lactamase class C family)
MKKILFLGSFLLLLSCTNAIVEPGVVPKKYDFSSVDQFIEENASVYKNEVVVLVSKNGKLIYQNEHNLTATANRVIASASKWLSGAVIMSLVDDRRLSLDDTVGKFYPSLVSVAKGISPSVSCFPTRPAFLRFTPGL